LRSDGRLPDSSCRPAKLVNSAMKAILDHLDNLIRPALQAYLASERELDIAKEKDVADEIDAARRNVNLAARQAVDLLHHFADFVLKEPDPALPVFNNIGEVRRLLKPLCVFTRTQRAVDDVALLMDVTDAFKHHRPDRSSATVDVSFAIVTSYGGYGELGWGEGKYGGAEQVIVTRTSGEKRALSSILQNVFDAWMTLLKQPLPPINQY
jgi:hypothetical protein